MSNVDESTDIYFYKTRLAATHNPFVKYQIFHKRDAVLCGTHHLLNSLGSSADCIIRGLEDGTIVKAGDPTHTIEGYLKDLVEWETVYLGCLAEFTKIATNVHAAVAAAKGKPVLFFPARFTLASSQYEHGYAAYIGGAARCSTQYQTDGFNDAAYDRTGKHHGFKPVGTMPHACIAAFDGSTAAASLAMAERLPAEEVWPLVDFENDCAKTAVEVWKAFREKGIEHRMAGVRLDTSEKLVDEGIAPKDVAYELYSNSTIGEHGVNPLLVKHVRKQLDEVGARKVKICVSGGFSPAKIQRFEEENVPADVYAVGEYFLTGSFPFTSDIVQIRQNDGTWKNVAKVGRGLLPEPVGFKELGY